MIRGMNNMQANICLFTVTLCWSCEVVIFSIIPDDVNPFATTCVTSLIGAALLFACFFRRIAEAFGRDRWLLARRIGLLGVMNTIYSVLFLIGLNYFDVSTGAFTVSITAMPVYGIFFGIPGCLANAVGNLIGDITSDSLRWSSIAGFVGNFVYPYLMYLFWTKLRKKPFNLRTRRVVVLFAATVVVCACAQSLIISPAVQWYYPDVDVMLFALIVVGNGTFFPIGFTIPFIIMLQEEFKFIPLGPKK